MNVAFRPVLLVPAIAMVLFIGGCDRPVSGVYTVEGTGMTVEFKSDKAVFCIGTETHETTYTVQGDKVNIAKDPGGEAISFTINKDGSMSGPGGMKLVKKS